MIGYRELFGSKTPSVVFARRLCSGFGAPEMFPMVVKHTNEPPPLLAFQSMFMLSSLAYGVG
jgi:hypothetical protein